MTENKINDVGKMSQEETDELALMQFFRNFKRLRDTWFFMNSVLDKPEDRLFHAEDKTWWKREGVRLIQTDPPHAMKLAPAVKDTCRWWDDYETSMYESECGNCFDFDGDGDELIEEYFKFCPYCGKELEVCREEEEIE